jgi:hypothetical protein
VMEACGVISMAMVAPIIISQRFLRQSVVRLTQSDLSGILMGVPWLRAGASQKHHGRTAHPPVVEYLQFRMGSAHNSAAWFARWETRINGTEDLQEFGQGARAR